MNERTFLSSADNGLARATEISPSKFKVERLLPGVRVRALAASPLNQQRVYAATDEMGVLISDDRGQTWGHAGLALRTVTAIAVSPIAQDVVYAGTRPAQLYVSRDGGVTWRELPGFNRIPGRRFWFSPAEKPFVAYVQAIALSPTDPLRIAVGIEFGATVTSGDGGETWTGHLKGALRDCHSLVFHPTDGNWIYEAGGTGGGAAYSCDGGRAWRKAGTGLDRHYGWAAAGDYGDPSVWYVSVATGPRQAHGERSAEARIFRRTRDGWQLLAGGLPQPLSHMPYALIPSRHAQGALYAALSNGDIWQTKDYGDTWNQLDVTLGAVYRAAIML